MWVMSFGKPPEKRTFFWKHNTILHKTRNKIKRFSEKNPAINVYLGILRYNFRIFIAAGLRQAAS